VAALIVGRGPQNHGAAPLTQSGEPIARQGSTDALPPVTRFDDDRVQLAQRRADRVPARSDPTKPTILLLVSSSAAIHSTMESLRSVSHRPTTCGEGPVTHPGNGAEGCDRTPMIGPPDRSQGVGPGGDTQGSCRVRAAALRRRYRAPHQCRSGAVAPDRTSERHDMTGGDAGRIVGGTQGRSFAEIPLSTAPR
jgi:hypothetical protein